MAYVDRTAAPILGSTVDTTAYRILLVEDHPVVRLGLRTVVAAQSDMEIVGEAESARVALSLVAELHPDLVIQPLRLEGELRGVELCRELKSTTPAPRVLIYSSYNSTDETTSSFLSGADSFVHKGEPSAQLLQTIRSTLAGRRSWLLGIETNDQTARFQEVIDQSGLTDREREVLGFMLQRFTNAQIANELYIELPTVKTHVSNILAKLGLRSRHELF